MIRQPSLVNGDIRIGDIMFNSEEITKAFFKEIVFSSSGIVRIIKMLFILIFIFFIIRKII